MTGCEHEWMVFSTALTERCLLLGCSKCTASGSVDKPTKEEWSQAYYAPSNPYRWYDNSRVTMHNSNHKATEVG